MTAGYGSIEISTCRSGARTILERVRYDGISRCSRAFAHGDAALVVCSQLGPGVVRGDVVSLAGHIGADSHLIVTAQSATRLLGGPSQANGRSAWIVDAGASLELIGEPLIAHGGARYASVTTIDLETGAYVLLTDVARVPGNADVTLRTTIRQAERELWYDAVHAAKMAPATVGTLVVAGLPACTAQAIIVTLDPLADARADMSIGIGVFSTGVVVRILGDDVWDVRAALLELRLAIRAILAGLAPMTRVAAPAGH